MKSSALAEFVRLLRKEGVAEFSGVEPDLDVTGWSSGAIPHVHLKLGPLPPEQPRPVEAAAPRPVVREPLPPELAPFMTPDLAAELTATLED